MKPVFVVTGPSGAGKGTLIRGLLERLPQLEVAISATTRPMRAGEEDGREYWFLDDERVQRAGRRRRVPRVGRVRLAQALRDAPLGDRPDRRARPRLRPRARARRGAARAGRGAGQRAPSSSPPTSTSSSAGCASVRRSRPARSRIASRSPATSSSRRTGSATWCGTTTSRGPARCWPRSSNGSSCSQVPWRRR